MTPGPRVLIVDESDDSRQVLRTALERSGFQILEARRADDGLALARHCRPDLIVVDLEEDKAWAEALVEGFATESQAQETPLILIGSIRHRYPPELAGEFIRKPYQYAPLIRKIESLLARAA